MLIVMKLDASSENIEQVKEMVLRFSCESKVVVNQSRTMIHLFCDQSNAVNAANIANIDVDLFRILNGVESVVSVTSRRSLVGRETQKEDTMIRVGGVTFGPQTFVIIAGPCAVESEAQTLRIAHAVKNAGAHILRGGAYKPRTSPYSFQGLGREGLKILKKAGQETGLPVIIEALDSESLQLVSETADMIQIGTRNMQNYSLLKECGKLKKPIMLKRGMSSTIDEWLMAAEYILNEGNPHVLLCERGIRSFDSKYTRNVVDLGAVPVVKGLSHLPVAVDPSHGTGRRDMVESMSLGAVAVGANAVMIDVHDQPEDSMCDGAQAIAPEHLTSMIARMKAIASFLGKEV